MRKTIHIIFFLLISAITFSQSVNNAVPARPEPPKLVNDFTKTLTENEKAVLEEKLELFEKKSSTQIVVVIIQSLKGYDVADYALAILRKWGVGQKDKNNGVVLLISLDERGIDINTGYGLEGSLDDVTAKRIIDLEIVPEFKRDNYYGGVKAGTDKIIKAVEGEYIAPAGYGDPKISKGKIILFIILLLLFLYISSRGDNGGFFMSRRGHRGWGGRNIFWTGGSDWGGGGWGGGGSSGGGGFGGFGGGSGGGGGASGNW